MRIRHVGMPRNRRVGRKYVAELEVAGFKFSVLEPKSPGKSVTTCTFGMFHCWYVHAFVFKNGKLRKYHLNVSFGIF